MRVLVVDDSAPLRSLLDRSLRRDGHTVALASSLASADEALHRAPPDVVILELALPDGWGAAWCRRVRRDGVDAAVIVLTAHADVAHRLEGFGAGADDFLAKPFAVAELLARVRAVGRRRLRAQPAALRRGDVSLEIAQRRATRGGAFVSLTAREWEIVERLAAAKGGVVRRSSLLDDLWGAHNEAAEASLEVLVGRIRRKLGPGWVRTARGIGYALDDSA